MNLSQLDLLSYRNEKVISRYRKEYSDSKLSAEEAFSELMRYFWLCKKHEFDKNCLPNDDSLNFRCAMHVEMGEIDNMWHTFLLFTRDYQAFCNYFFEGEFLHHDPLFESNNISKKAYESELRRYLTYIHNGLGAETLVKWFKI